MHKPHMKHDLAAPQPWIPIGPAVTSGVELPVSSESLLGRIIRNPVPAGRPPRERECIEMLAGALSLAPRARDALVGLWLEGDS